MSTDFQALETTRELVRANFVERGRTLVWPDQLVEAGVADRDAAIEILLLLSTRGVLSAKAEILSAGGHVLWSGPLNEMPERAEFPSPDDDDDFGEGGVSLVFEVSHEWKQVLEAVKKNRPSRS